MNTKNKIAGLKILLAAGFLLVLLNSVPIVNAQQNEIKWHPFEEAISLAQETGKPILVDVWAPWCGWCRKLKKEVYPKLSAELEKYILTRLNREDNKTTVRFQGKNLTPLRIAQKIKAETVPTITVLNSDANYLIHLSGFMKSESLQPVLSYIASGEYKKNPLRSTCKKGS
ncbi:MAG: thioredoxin fold domain-containing protein [Balneolaceae bacterium]|nr:thioredoxin fold domain-containing protein [Balneolaceae bacterium]